MRIVTVDPDPSLVIRLEECSDGVLVVAHEGELKQRLLKLTTSGGKPCARDPLAQNGDTLRLETFVLSAKLKAETTDEGHLIAWPADRA